MLAAYIGSFIFIFGTYGAIDEFYPLLYEDVGFSKSGIGIIGLISYSFFALGGYLSRQKFIKKISISFMILVTAVIYILIYIDKSFKTLWIVIPFSAIFTILQVRITSQMQKYINSEVRATISSINSMLREGVGILVTLLL